MKKQLLSAFTVLFGVLAFGQVGVNTATPQSTFDVTAKKGATDIDGLQAPRLRRLELTTKGNTLYGITQMGSLIYITDVFGGDTAGPRVNITSPGYYYFDGSLWQKVLGQDTNIYNSNGTLAANRTVTMADKTLDFTSAATTGTSHYTIDGSTFNVNTIDNRIGIGTNIPLSVLNVINPIAGNTVDAFSVGINNCGAACAQGTARNMVLYNANPSNAFFASIDFVPSNSPTGLSGATIRGIDRDAANNYAGFSFVTRNATDYADRLTIKSSGLVGIANALPATTLDVAGKIDATTPDGVTVPRFTTAELAAKDAVYGPSQNSTMVFVTSGTGLAGKTSNITGPGFYYYDNATSKWKAVSSSGTFAEADGVIGNEVLNATAGGALTRSGAGTAADPYTLGVPDQGITTAKIADENVTYAKIKTTVRTVTASYTLAADDEGGFVYVDSASATTITVPGTLPPAFHCVVVQQGAGQVTVAGSGVTMTTARGTKTRTQYSAIGIIKQTAAAGTITGDAIN